MNYPTRTYLRRACAAASVLAIALVGTTAIAAGASAATAARPRTVNGGCSNYLPTGTVVAMAASPDGSGYWIVNGAGQVVNCGGALSLPSLGPINLPIVGMASTPDGQGAW